MDRRSGRELEEVEAAVFLKNKIREGATCVYADADMLWFELRFSCFVLCSHLTKYRIQLWRFTQQPL